MDKEKLKEALFLEKKKYANKNFEELTKIDIPIVYECGSGNDWYQVEVQLLEKTDNYVHISIAVDDGKGIHAMLPMCDDFILYKDGKLES